MLDACDAEQLIESVWNSDAPAVELPAAWTDFFNRAGAMDRYYDEKRRFHRYYLRARGALEVDGALHPIIVKDVSRVGVGFYSAAQWFPRDAGRVLLPTGRDFEIRVARCVRIQKNCYECGTRHE